MIFEGFMDVISASMAEKPVGVATMGTALTRDHVRQLSHVAKRILLVYDGDEAGQNAARRSIDLIREYAKNVDIGVVYLPDHLDPDEVRVQRGLSVLKQTLEQNIQTPVEFLVNAARVGKNLSNQVQYLAFLQEVMKTLKSASPVEQDIQLTRIANEFGTSKHALQTQLQQSVTQKASKSQQTYSTMVEPPLYSNDYDGGLGQKDINQSITQVEQAERALIMAMIKSSQVMVQVKETAGFAFVHPDYQLLMMLTNIYQTQHPGDFDLAQYMDFIQKPELNQKIMAIDRSYGDIAIEKAAINDYLRVIMHDAPIDARIRELQQAINTAKQQHDDAKLLQFMTELINIKKKQSEL